MGELLFWVGAPAAIIDLLDSAIDEVLGRSPPVVTNHLSPLRNHRDHGAELWIVLTDLLHCVARIRLAQPDQCVANPTRPFLKRSEARSLSRPTLDMESAQDRKYRNDVLIAVSAYHIERVSAEDAKLWPLDTGVHR